MRTMPTSPDGQADFPFMGAPPTLCSAPEPAYMGGRREDRRFGLIRLALVFALALVWGAAFAETALKAPPQNPSQVRLSFAPVGKKVTPAGVHVYASRVETAPRNPLFDDPIFRRFFGGGGDDSRVSKALGSGVIVEDRKSTR